MIEPDGIRAAAARELELHPLDSKGKPISAWERRAETIGKTIDSVNEQGASLTALEDDYKAFKEDISSRPF